MTFDSIDPRSLHRGISIAKEIPPGAPASTLETITGGTGEILAGRTIKQAEYTVRINIAGRSARDGWEIRRLIAAWARPTDKTTRRLVPTHWPEVYYDAACKEVTEPEFTFGFCTVDVVFAIARPIAMSLHQTVALPDYGSKKIIVRIGGTHYAKPDIVMDRLTAGEDGLTLYVDDAPLLKVAGAIGEGECITLSGGDHPRLTQKSTNAEAADITKRIAYAGTDFASLWQAFAPGVHAVRTVPESEISLQWRDEWV